MAITSVTATNPAESSKSINITLNSKYANETITLMYSSTINGTFTDVTSNYDISLVKDSSKADTSSAYYYCLIVGKFDFYEYGKHNSSIQSLIDQTLKDGYYKVRIGSIDASYSSNSSVNVEPSLSSGSEFDNSIPVTAIGSSIVQLRFTAPIRNLFVNHYDSNYNSNILDNISYKSDEIGAIETPFKVNSENFKGYLSNDGKVLTLESLDISFIKGTKITAYINFPKFQQTIKNSNTVLTNYDKSLTILSSDYASDSNAVLIENNEAIVTAAIGNRTNLNLTFDKPVLLPSKEDLNVNNILFVESPTERGVILTAVTRSSYDFVTGTNANIKSQYVKFSLDILPTASNALPSKNTVLVSIGAMASAQTGALVDASALLVRKTSIASTITIEKPKFISATQDLTPTIENYTIIDIIFSQPMNIINDVPQKSAMYHDNYDLVISERFRTTHIYPIDVKSIPDSNNTKFKLIFDHIITTNPADTVEIVLTSAITNSLGDAFNMSGANKKISLNQLKDVTIPKVKQIIGLSKSPDNKGITVTDKDNALIIKFNSSMNRTGANSALEPTNYEFIESTVPSTNAPLKATISPIPKPDFDDDLCILFTVDTHSNYPVFEKIDNLRTIDTTTGKPNLNYNIHIGYLGTTSTDTRYVENDAGTIYDLCDYRKIDATVPLIDLSKGTVTIVNDSMLLYNYTDKSIINNIVYHNEFRIDTITSDNFQIYELEEPDCSSLKTELPIIYATQGSTNNEIIFLFPNDTFCSNTKYIYLTTKNNNHATVYDVFNKEVNGMFCSEVINNIPAALNSLTLIDITRKVSVDPNNQEVVGYPIEIAASFAKPISITSPGDFVIGFADAPSNIVQNIAISSANILKVNGKNNNVIIIKAYIGVINFDFINGKFLVRTSNDSEYLITKDCNNKSIQAFSYTNVESINIDNAIFKFNIAYDLNRASLSAQYNNDLVDASLPPEILTASGLLVQNVKFVQQATGSNFYYIDLSTTVPSLGYLTLAVNVSTDPIFMNSTNDTAFNITINKLNTDTLVFEFSKSDVATDLTLNMANVIYIQFIPSKYSLMGTDAVGYNVYANASPEDNANASIK